MKILLRKHHDEQYVWKTAKYFKDGFYVKDEHIYETNIVSIQNDNRKNYVRCSHCADIVHKDRVAEHRERYKHSEFCLNCRNMSASWVSDGGTKYKKGKNGNYIMEVKKEVKLYCISGFGSREIDSEAARERCTYSGCEYADMHEISDIFTTHKGLFDDIILVNKLADIGYDKAGSFSDGFWTDYRLNTRLPIFASANSLGIIDHFNVHINWDEYRVYYSKKFDKLYTTQSRKYVEGIPYIETEIIEEVKNEIRKLYI